ncbi:MAG: hypothetical protein A2651_01345 [Candidatus Yanofskybacteria bacterium RIFCSPHIGHO2_01_FULL_42_12]|uniref:D,D-heptose 1,7-bisphosphate phosphatase n=1 Tax=Candidatus Yanofskybacteria bacterium RIFCSPLOWO2_01_FULL_42_49 TaxID=1802694 RepID=A0A1F8GCL6_9BACT|nr:MAG: hypothetical protein A2651_01345 [Candidatus Yanofskybacteria bacterium RIFCSPHIGHO2_01_FULL_42_12]OGN22209.1 MAG: hypothetical protein A2918_03085 [Candidatus Yanofskybacteria bacterium RIFCSPLOWO2_01_FULL_42_49]
MEKYLILDRDGVLIKDKGYVHKIKDLELLPGVVEGLQKFRDAGYKFIVISNQAGIARGLYTRRDAERFNNKLKAILASDGIVLEKFYYCEHHPDINGRCNCRKPATGLVTKAVEEFEINLSDACFIGDKDCDIELGKNCGGITVLIDSGQYPNSVQPDFKAKNLEHAFELLKNR